MFEGAFSPFHWLLVIAVGLLLFGPNKVADLGKGLGQGIKNFKDALNENSGTDAAAKDAAAKKDGQPVA